MKDIIELQKNENKLIKKLMKSYVPDNKGIEDIKELLKILEVNEDINILTRKDTNILCLYMYILGKEAGKKQKQ